MGSTQHTGDCGTADITDDLNLFLEENVGDASQGATSSDVAEFDPAVFDLADSELDLNLNVSPSQDHPGSLPEDILALAVESIGLPSP